jgi:hypothetical protein
MGIEWCRVPSIIIFALAATLVRQGVKPVSVLSALIVGTPTVGTLRHGFSQAPQVRR